VSNPPYIPQAEQEKLHRNVSEHEPWLALFVPDGDALVFYRAIAQFGKEHLAAGGAIYCEIESSLGEACRALFEEERYEAELRKDMHGNWRMIKAVKEQDLLC
jgi:release factor glutamine methyltransferase